MVGGAGRFYLSPRIAIGPELLWISGDNHSHTVLTGGRQAGPMTARVMMRTCWLIRPQPSGSAECRPIP
jgi:hypothetical protein